MVLRKRVSAVQGHFFEEKVEAFTSPPALGGTRNPEPSEARSAVTHDNGEDRGCRVVDLLEQTQ